MTPRPLRTALFTALALVGFAANSLLCRAALGPGLIDASSFTAIRLAAGAVTLSLLVRGARPAVTRADGLTALALFAYAAAFSYAYLRLPTGTGALLLFGAVQVTMLGWGLRRGERPHLAEWIGLAAAFTGLVALTRPGLTAPDPLGAGLMVGAGVAWGVYSLRGRGVASPLGATARNFVLTVPMAAVLMLVTLSGADASGAGIALAVTSGSITSGLAYTIWYVALRGLTATRAALVQLLVPVLAAAGGVALLAEVATVRLWVSGAIVLGGVALALFGRQRALAAAPRW